MILIEEQRIGEKIEENTYDKREAYEKDLI